MKLRRFRSVIFPIVIGFLTILSALAGWARPAGAQTMPPLPTGDRLAPPPTVYPPTQAGEGAQVYWQVCMVCHGDAGQGLTEEWRASLGPVDMDCWQSGCHGKRHPEEGFEIPRAAPRVIGGGAMARFNTALELHDYLSTNMPWHAPGSLQPQEYWQLTAFLLEKNGYRLPARPLDATGAAGFELRQPAPSDNTAWRAWLPFLGVAGLMAVLLVALMLRRR